MPEPIRFPAQRHLSRRSAREIALLNAIIARDERIADLGERLADAEAARDIAREDAARARGKKYSRGRIARWWLL